MRMYRGSAVKSARPGSGDPACRRAQEPARRQPRPWSEDTEGGQPKGALLGARRGARGEKPRNQARMDQPVSERRPLAAGREARAVAALGSKRRGRGGSEELSKRTQRRPQCHTQQKTAQTRP